MFKTRQKEQTYLLPVDICELLPENFLRDAVDEIVEKFFAYRSTTVVIRGRSNVGNPAYPPQVVSKVLLFGYMNGVYSSRQLEKKTRVDLECMYLSEKYTLDFGTIARFRRENGELFKEIFLYFVAVLKKIGMLDHLALFTDSTKIKANASDDRYLARDELLLYKELIEDAMKMHEINDAEEERLNCKIEKRVCRKSVRKMRRLVREVVEDVNAEETGRVEEKLERAERGIAMVEAKNMNGINMTDHDARFMKNGKTITHSYSAQTTVDGNGFIVAAGTVNHPDDYGEGVPQLEQAKVNLGLESLKGAMHAADGGFGSIDLLKYYEKHGIDGLVPQKTFHRGRYSLSSYKYDEGRNVFVAPDGTTLYSLRSMHTVNGKKRYVYEPDVVRKKGLRRKIIVEETFFLRERMRKKMEQNGKRYKKRAATVERIYGDIKHNRKFRMVQLRGLPKVETEVYMIATAFNLRRFCFITAKKQAAA